MPFGFFDPTRCRCEGGPVGLLCVFCSLHADNDDDIAGAIALILFLLWILL